VIYNSEAVQQDRRSTWLKVNSSKLILAVMYLRRVEIDGRSYAAASTQVSTVVTPPAPAAQISALAFGGPARQKYSGTKIM
jgi:hypothetical protein